MTCRKLVKMEESSGEIRAVVVKRKIIIFPDRPEKKTLYLKRGLINDDRESWSQEDCHWKHIKLKHDIP